MRIVTRELMMIAAVRLLVITTRKCQDKDTYNLTANTSNRENVLVIIYSATSTAVLTGDTVLRVWVKFTCAINFPAKYLRMPGLGKFIQVCRFRFCSLCN